MVVTVFCEIVVQVRDFLAMIECGPVDCRGCSVIVGGMGSNLFLSMRHIPIIRFFVLMLTLSSAGRAQDLSELQSKIAREFPEVAQISRAYLAERLDGSLGEPRPILIDVREAEEFAVSHLSGAFRATVNIPAQLAERGVSPDALIVVYCSVGYRSAQLAEQLAFAGYTRVFNLEGSIFAWANEGRPLVNPAGPTTGVHPYDAKWGVYLNQSLWAWTPE